MYQIGQLAKRLGLTTATLRFYEQQGLLSAPLRAENGYRYYYAQHEHELRFITRAKQAGLSNRDVRELLTLKASPEQASCGDVKSIIEAKLAKVRAQLAQLQGFEAQLASLAARCDGGELSASHCTILEMFNDTMD